MDPNFDSLRQLLALKRHEQPPPGYFDRLPRQISARLQAREEPRLPRWWHWWIGQLDFRPALAGALGLACGAVYFLGLSLTQSAERGWVLTPGGQEELRQQLALWPTAQPVASFPKRTWPSGLRALGASSMHPVLSAANPWSYSGAGATGSDEPIQRVSHTIRGN